MSEIRVFSFNIWTDGRADGGASSGNPRCFAIRRELIKKNFPAYDADIVGFQETMPAQRQWLIDTFTDYQVCGIGRDRDLQGESNVVMFKKDKFDLVNLDTFWLSDTPYMPGSRFTTDQSDCPRICTCAVLLARDTTKRLRVYNTHLDHVGPVARVQGIEMVLARIASDVQRYPDTPVVLMGDFNEEPGGIVTRAIDMESDGLVEATRNIPGTFHGYHPETGTVKIDYIYTNACWEEEKTYALTDSRDGIYLSDHYPVMTQITI